MAATFAAGYLARAPLPAAMTMREANGTNAADPGPENSGQAGINPDALDPSDS